MSGAVCMTSPTKKRRRTKQEIKSLCDAMVEAIRRTEAAERETLAQLAAIWNADEEDNPE